MALASLKRQLTMVCEDEEVLSDTILRHPLENPGLYSKTQ